MSVVILSPEQALWLGVGVVGLWVLGAVVYVLWSVFK